MNARVIVTRGCFNIATMQVCAVDDASDAEIIEVCNRENPAGTQDGWTEVIRTVDEASIFKGENKLPVKCAQDPARTHFLVLC